jgi:DNA-binding HxlR family transcriptional regulator
MSEVRGVFDMPSAADHRQKIDPLRDGCPVKAAVDVIRGRWKPSIIRELRDGKRRFSELRAALPSVTAQILSVQLRQLEADGIVTRKVYAEVPARVEYELSEYGWTLSRVMEELEAWGTTYLQRQQKQRAAEG